MLLELDYNTYVDPTPEREFGENRNYGIRNRGIIHDPAYLQFCKQQNQEPAELICNIQDHVDFLLNSSSCILIPDNMKSCYVEFVQYLAQECTGTKNCAWSSLLKKTDIETRHKVLFNLGNIFEMPIPITQGVTTFDSDEAQNVPVILYSHADMLKDINNTISCQRNYSVITKKRAFLTHKGTDAVLYSKKNLKIKRFKTADNYLEPILEIVAYPDSTTEHCFDTTNKVVFFTEDGIFNKTYYMCDRRYSSYKTYIFDISSEYIRTDDEEFIKRFAFISLSSLRNYDTQFIAVFLIDGRHVKNAVINGNLLVENIVVCPAKISLRNKLLSNALQVSRNVKYIIECLNDTVSLINNANGCDEDEKKDNKKTHTNLMTLKNALEVYSGALYSASHIIFENDTSVNMNNVDCNALVNQSLDKIVIKGLNDKKGGIVIHNCNERTKLRTVQKKFAKRGRPSKLQMAKLYNNHGLRKYTDAEIKKIEETTKKRQAINRGSVYSSRSGKRRRTKHSDDYDCDGQSILHHGELSHNSEASADTQKEMMDFLNEINGK